jgi:polar amino acid transport system ATP-binding protein/sulfate transport system ATP-binding protein
MASMEYHLGQALLTIDDVSLKYDRQILKHVNAQVQDIVVDRVDENGKHIVKGQVVGFLGPSGIGKTQLFRIVSGLNKPTSGHVYINNCHCGRPDCGKDKCEVRAGDVGVVAQSYPLFYHRTVKSNLMIAAMQTEKDSKVAMDKIMGYLTEFGLADKLLSYPGSLSGGQRQRIAIIQQILCSAHYILMDEPFSGLDPINLEKVASLIQQVANMDDLNTVIVVTHDVTAACAVADHIWMLGRDHDAAGATIDGSYIVKSYNLIDLDLAWHPDIITSPNFMTFVGQVKREFKSL